MGDEENEASNQDKNYDFVTRIKSHVSSIRLSVVLVFEGFAMKRLMVALLCSLFFTSVTFAATQTVNGVTWDYVVSNGTAKIYDIMATSSSPNAAISSSTVGAITIPSTLGGYPVTSIGNYAFYGCRGLTSVTIPEGVTSIGDAAFHDCSGVTSVTIPNGVTSIGDSAFYGCSGLTSIKIPESVTSIGSWSFSRCSALTSFTIPEGVTSIKLLTFWSCSSLKSINIPSSVTSIRGFAFEDCSSLTSITIPSSVISIENGTFKSCSSLTSITIPSSVISIGDSAFKSCSSLTSITIPSSVTFIGDSAFNRCTGLMSVMFRGKPPSIGESVFAYGFSGCKGCYSLEYVSEWEAVIDETGVWAGLKMQTPTRLARVGVEIIGEGTVAGTGLYEVGEAVTLTATPSKENLFCGWNVPTIKSSTYTFRMPEEDVEVTAYFANSVAVGKYVVSQELTTKEEAKQALLEANEVFTADEMKSLALGAPVIQVKNGKAIVGISLNKVTTLNGEWQKVEDIEVEVTPDVNEKAAFYQFVVPER